MAILFLNIIEFLSVIATETDMDCYFQTFELKTSQWGFGRK